MNADLKSPLSPKTGADLARFRQKHGLTVSRMCALFGISTQAKFNDLVRPEQDGGLANTALDPTLAMLLRLYEEEPQSLPLRRQFTLRDAFGMFKRTFGDALVNESVFGVLMGRSPGSGYRWLNSAGKATPQVLLVLERLYDMLASGMEEPEACLIWLDVVQREWAARGQTPPLEEIKPRAILHHKYPLKYSSYARRA